VGTGAKILTSEEQLRTREVILNTATAVAVGCAIVSAIGAVRSGSLFGGQSAKSVSANKPRPVANWEQLLSTGRRIGPESAVVTLIEFGDFECPACAAYEQMLDTVRTRYPMDFAVVFHHFPLPYHHLAYPLARASECAATQGKFTEFHDAAYAHPESLGVVPVSALGAKIALPNVAAFERCFADTARVSRIEADLKTAKRIGVPGTPGVILDGQLRSADVRVDELESLIRKRLAARHAG
jgi:protein-disulfide isomerase